MDKYSNTVFMLDVITDPNPNLNDGLIIGPLVSYDMVE